MLAADPWAGFAGAATQAGVIAIGGIWALVLYFRRREFKATVRIAAWARLVASDDGKMRVFVRIHMVNESAVFINVTAAVVLMRVRLSGTYPRFRIIGKEYPLEYVYGEVRKGGQMGAEDGDIINDGEMEPNECIETEVVFSVAKVAPSSLLAVRLSVEGTKPRRLPEWLRRTDEAEAAEWDTFAYLDPSCHDGTRYMAITSPHGADET